MMLMYLSGKRGKLDLFTSDIAALSYFRWCSLVEDLEENPAALGVRSFSLSVTTLEEVIDYFLSKHYSRKKQALIKKDNITK